MVGTKGNGHALSDGPKYANTPHKMTKRLVKIGIRINQKNIKSVELQKEKKKWKLEIIQENRKGG